MGPCRVITSRTDVIVKACASALAASSMKPRHCAARITNEAPRAYDGPQMAAVPSKMSANTSSDRSTISRMRACYTAGFVGGTESGKRPLVIAIDGPSGAGKGTVARAVASRLGYRHVDTGAMYRAVAWLAMERGLALDDQPAVSTLASNARLELADGSVHIDGHDATQAIRTPAIDRGAAAVARIPGVRRALVERQRALGSTGGIVMEGRDIGTVVFPAADVKIYLDADPAERARRRAADPAHAGSATALPEVASAMADRDRQDTTRTTSPLIIAPDAVRVDTTALDVDEVVDRVLKVIEGHR
jgi:CMP/dCMP kinase